MDTQLRPGEDLKKLVKRTEATRQSNKSVSFLSHQRFAFMHGLNQDQLAQILMRDLDGGEGTRNHSDDFTAMGERSVGHRAHQAYLGATVHQAQPGFSQQAAQSDCFRTVLLLCPNT